MIKIYILKYKQLKFALNNKWDEAEIYCDNGMTKIKFSFLMQILNKLYNYILKY